MDEGLLLLRLVLGCTLAAHGAQKLFGLFGGGGLAGTGRWMASIGFVPGRRNAVLAGGTELGAGLLLAVGLATPLAAAGFVGVMLVAGVVDHADKGFFIVRGGWEYTFVLAASAAAIAATGPGRWSLDAALGVDRQGIGWAVGAVALGGAAAAAQLATRRSTSGADSG